MKVYRRIKTAMRRRILSLAHLPCRLRSHRQIVPVDGARLMATLKPEAGNLGAAPSPEDMSRKVPSAPPSPPETMNPAPEAEGASSPETVVTPINALPTSDQVLHLESMKATTMIGEGSLWRAAASEGAATMIQKNVRGNQARRRSGLYASCSPSLGAKPPALSHQLHQVVQAEIKVEKKRKVTLAPQPSETRALARCLRDLPPRPAPASIVRISPLQCAPNPLYI